jgi:hypothetical protein
VGRLETTRCAWAALSRSISKVAVRLSSAGRRGEEEARRASLFLHVGSRIVTVCRSISRVAVRLSSAGRRGEEEARRASGFLRVGSRIVTDRDGRAKRS